MSMRHLSVLCALLLLSTGGAQAESARYIVTLKGPAVFEQDLSKSARADRAVALTAQQDRVLGTLGAAKSKALIHRYLYTANGLALELSTEQVVALSQSPDVAHIEADRWYAVSTDSSVAQIGAPAVWAAASGRRGAGVVVGVIDTGINAGHPAFADRASDGYDHTNPRGRTFGLCANSPGRCNDKLIGIYDFTEEGQRDGSDVDGHGSHVAGTAVGNPVSVVAQQPTVTQTLAITGVAPRASLISYKACTNRTEDNPNTCRGSDLVAAIDRATSDGVDVINYSIGGGSVDPWALLASGVTDQVRSMWAARRAGIFIAVSAGNSGPALNTLTSPAVSPWVVSVAASTKSQVLQTRLFSLVGSTPPPQPEFVGQSISAALPARSIVLASSFGSALCSNSSTALDFPPTGATNPFPPGTFQGQIVVCERGVNARVAKSFNLQAAGAGGMILVNTALEGESINADGHYLPTVHLGRADGARLVAWLSAAGGSARGQISATAPVTDAGQGDRLASFSSRGNSLSRVLKPNMAAPGVSIFAPAGTGSGVAILSGTSMASPHVAGAAALLKAELPGLRADGLESLLTLTTTTDVRRDDGSPAAAFERGAGRIRVDQARRGGLYLPLVADEFSALGAAPSPTQIAGLNLPQLYAERCLRTCSFTRRVAAVQGVENVQWQIQSGMPAGIGLSADPVQFTSGTSAQSLQLTFQVNDPALYGQALQGVVRLVPTNRPDLATLAIPVALTISGGSVPSALSVALASDSGRTRVSVGPLEPTTQLRAVGQGFGAVRVEQGAVTPDTTPSSAFDNDSGTFRRFFDVPAGTLLLRVDTIASPASVDLYVGRDAQADNSIESAETLCRQTGISGTRRCLIEQPAAGRYWMLAHNVSGPAGGSTVGLRFASSLANNNRVVAISPRQLAAAQLVEIALDVDLGGLPFGQAQLGALALYSADSQSKPLAIVPIDVTPAQGALSSRSLEPGGLSVGLTVGAGVSHIGLSVDVPTGQSTLRLTSADSDTIDLRLIAAPSAASSGPTVAPANLAGPVLASATGAASTKVLTLNNPAAGRYHVVAQNMGATSKAFSLKAELTGPFSLTPAPEVYFNPARSGHGLFLTRARDDLQVVWYSYDEANRPTFWLGFADGYFNRIGAVQGFDLLRAGWDGSSARVDPVGRAWITPQDASSFLFSYQIAGVSSSERMQRLATGQCVDVAGRNLDLSGLWFEPSRSGYGVNWLTTQGQELVVSYVYDSFGEPRWWLGQNTNFTGQFALSEFRGPCPGCPAIATTSQPVGQFTRVRIDPTPALPQQVLTGQWRFNGNFSSGGGSFTADGVIALLTGLRSCVP